MLRRLASTLTALAALVAPAPVPAAVPGDIIVTEILYDPNAVFDSAGEWFEVYNASAGVIDMNGWRLQDNPSGNHLINRPGGLLIPPGGRLVFGNNANALTNGGVPVDHQFPGSGTGSLALANGGDFVRLVDAAGVLIDIVTYDRSTSGQFPNVSAGFAIALADLTADNAVGASWCAAATPFGAGDKGTPRQANDCPPPPERCGNGLDDDRDGAADCADPECATFILCRPRALFSEAGGSGGYAAECSGAVTTVPLQGRAAFGAISVSEIMNNPTAVDDVFGEWFEVVNRSSQPVDMGSWTLSDDDFDTHVIAGPLVVPAGGRIVLGRDDNPAVNGGVIVDYEYASFTLGNEDDEINLIDTAGRLVDRLRYDNGMSFPDPTAKSMVMLDDLLDNASGANWCLSITPFGAGDLATPRAPNSCAGTVSGGGGLVVSEIMKNPARTGDASGEWLELHNRTASPIDIDGFTLRDDDFDLHVIDQGSALIVPAGGRLVLGNDLNPATNGGVAVAHAWNTAQFALGNDDDEIVLLDLSLNEVLRVEYDNAVTFPDPDGGAMALKAADLDPAVGSNWCIALTAYGAGDRGTPGAINDCRNDIVESGIALAWTTDCPAGVVANPSAAATSLTLAQDECVVDCTVTLRATSTRETAVGTSAVRVSDTTAPSLAAAADLSVEALAPSSGPLSEAGWLASASASDSCSSASVRVRELSREDRCGATYVAGFAFVAVDACGNESAPVVRRYFVVDTTAPVITSSPGAPVSIWPPNHRMVSFDLASLGASAVDAAGTATLSITGCRSNEADNSRGDGSTVSDCVVDADGAGFRVRAERSGRGIGRTYAITGVAVDECGNESAEALLAFIEVPRSRSRP